MDIESILTELRREKDRIASAISSLLGTAAAAPRRRGRPPGKAAKVVALPATKKKVMSPAARKRISEAMKKRWAYKRKQES